MYPLRNIFLFSVATSLWLSAQSDISADWHTEVTIPHVITEESPFEGYYASLGFSILEAQHLSANEHEGVVLAGGYNFTPYVALEGRLQHTIEHFNLQEEYQGEFGSLSLFVKPQYLMMNIVTLYGLLGYSRVFLDDGTEEMHDDSLSYGIGASMMATDTTGIYLDYTSLYDDDGFDGLQEGNIHIKSISMGFFYTF